MPQNTKLTIGRGETFVLPMNLQLSDGTPRDITDLEFTGSVKETYSTDGVTPFTFTKNTPYASGSVEVSLTSAQTSVMKAADYVYTMFITSGSVTRILLEGQFIVRPTTR